MKEKNVSKEKTTLKNANVLKIVNELSENCSLITRSASCKLTGAFALSLEDLADKVQVFTGKVIEYALLVNTFAVRTAKINLSEIKHLEVLTDNQLFDNNLPKNCYRARWTVQLKDNRTGACTAMRGSDKIENNSDVVVTLSKGTFNNANFVKSVITRQ